MTSPVSTLFLKEIPMERNTWITSDLHFGHTAIIQFQRHQFNLWGGAQWDGKKDFYTKNMDATILGNINSVVAPYDVLYILGDVSFHKQAETTIQLLSQMNGIKHIIRGNHDHWLDAPAVKNEDNRRAARISSIQDYLEVSYNKHKLVMFHYPIEEWNGSHKGSLMLHGHQHGMGAVSPFRRKDIGLDTNELMPYNLDVVIEEMLTKEIYYAHRKR